MRNMNKLLKHLELHQQSRAHPKHSKEMLVGFNNISNISLDQHTFIFFPSVMKSGVNFCQKLTLLSPFCSLPCCTLSVCQNNEGKRNTAFGLEQGQCAVSHA